MACRSPDCEHSPRDAAFRAPCRGRRNSSQTGRGYTPFPNVGRTPGASQPLRLTVRSKRGRGAKGRVRTHRGRSHQALVCGGDHCRRDLHFPLDRQSTLRLSCRLHRSAPIPGRETASDAGWGWGDWVRWNSYSEMACAQRFSMSQKSMVAGSSPGAVDSYSAHSKKVSTSAPFSLNTVQLSV